MGESLPLVLLAAMMLIFWLLVIRPQRRQQQQVRQLQSSLEPGDRVIITAGIFGTVRSLTDDRAELEIAPDVVIEVARQVVVRKADELPVAGESSDAGTETD